MDFQQAYAGFRQLKQQFDSGQLTEADFKAQLQDLMVQDEQGCWWMIGRETGQWYRHDGADWVRADAPAVIPPPAIPPREPARGERLHAVEAAATPRPADHAVPAKVRPGWIAVLWITLGWAVGVGAVSALLMVVGASPKLSSLLPVGEFIGFADFADHKMPALISLLILGGLPGLVTAIVLRIQGVISRWKIALLIALTWAIGMALLASNVWTIGLALGGGLGGLAMALILHFTGVISDWKNLLWIALSWAFPGLISMIPTFRYQWVSLGSSILQFVIGVAIAAFILVWRLRQENKVRARSVSI